MAIEEIRKARVKKREKLEKQGIDPYPSVSWRTHTAVEAHEQFDELAESSTHIVLAGRLMLRREHGGSFFADIQDGTGAFQAYFKKDILGAETYDTIMETLDIGDFVELEGSVFLTKKKEQTLEVNKYRLLSKSLRPLPEKWHGLQDVEERYRKRYLDLVFNKDVKEKFEMRSRIIRLVRDFYNDNGFLEVETPILQTIAGGALAKPFKTHLNALGLDLYLRVAPELFLKRLLVGGFERVFEIGRNFRNEGMDRDHNPEFTMLEAYIAYRDYNWLMEFVEKLFAHLIEHTEVDFPKPPYQRLKYNDLLKKYVQLDYELNDEKEFRTRAEEVGVDTTKQMTKPNCADELFKKVIYGKLEEPIFLIDHPLEISPLAKKVKGEENFVQRFQFIARNFELVNAFTELNDPEDQKARFEMQSKMKGEEVHPFDKEYIEALEYGMPPATGIGLGIDRLVALLTGAYSIKEVILFPTMRDK